VRQDKGRKCHESECIRGKAGRDIDAQEGALNRRLTGVLAGYSYPFFRLAGGSANPMNPPSSERLTYVYRITPDDVIEFVNDAWGRFAKENGTPGLAQGVLGTSLWNYISGQEVIHLSRELFAKARDRKCEVAIPFRCDSPSVRRYMQMRVVPLTDRKLEFCTWIEREEPYSERIHLLDLAVPRDHEWLLRMCAWCKKIYVGCSWLEIEEAIGRMRLFDHVAMPTITHGICDRCFQMMAADFRPDVSEK
jgi:hypothetical protein